MPGKQLTMTFRDLRLRVFVIMLGSLSIALGCNPDKDKLVRTPPATTVSADSNVVREQIREMYIHRGEKAGNEQKLNELIQSLAHEYETVPVATHNELLKWKGVTLCNTKANFGAVRFTSPLNHVADMRWIIVLPRDVKPSWRILPAHGAMDGGFGRYWEEHDFVIDVEGIGIDVQNHAYLQPLDGGQIQPNQEYILWFCFEKAEPINVHLAIRLTYTGTFAKSNSSEDVASELGLPVPIQRGSTFVRSQLERRITWSYANRDLEDSLRVSEQLVKQFPPHRKARLWASSFNISRGELAREHGESDPNRYFFAAADHMREQRKRYPVLLTLEKACFAESCYYEAEAFAAQNEKSKAVASLTQALESGFLPTNVDESRFAIVPPEELVTLLARYKPTP